MTPRTQIDLPLLLKCIDEGYTGPRLADKFDVSIGCIKDRLDAFSPEHKKKMADNAKLARHFLGLSNNTRKWK